MRWRREPITEMIVKLQVLDWHQEIMAWHWAHELQRRFYEQFLAAIRWMIDDWQVMAYILHSCVLLVWRTLPFLARFLMSARSQWAFEFLYYTSVVFDHHQRHMVKLPLVLMSFANKKVGHRIVIHWQISQVERRRPRVKSFWQSSNNVACMKPVCMNEGSSHKFNSHFPENHLCIVIATPWRTQINIMNIMYMSCTKLGYYFCHLVDVDKLHPCLKLLRIVIPHKLQLLASSEKCTTTLVFFFYDFWFIASCHSKLGAI